MALDDATMQQLLDTVRKFVRNTLVPVSYTHLTLPTKA